MTIQQALTYASSRLADIEDANLIIYSILSYTLSLSKEYIWAHPDIIIVQSDFNRFMAYIDRAADYEPLGYIIGEKEFYQLPFYVTQDVLIPRPESEKIIELSTEYLSTLNQLSELPNIVDVGTGSGCIAITLAHMHPTSTVYAIDISQAALDVAQRNAERHNVTNVTFLRGSLLEPLQQLESKICIDLIVANLPYISDSEFESLPMTIKQYEPELALRSGSDPDVLNRNLIKQARHWVKPEGKLLYETTNGQIVELDSTQLI